MLGVNDDFHKHIWRMVNSSEALIGGKQAGKIETAGNSIHKPEAIIFGDYNLYPVVNAEKGCREAAL